jgi:hypothetical protein
MKSRRKFRKQYLTIKRSGLVDTAYYLETYPDVFAAGKDPIRHYVKYGAREGRDPSAQFDSDWYERSNIAM